MWCYDWLNDKWEIVCVIKEYKNMHIIFFVNARRLSWLLPWRRLPAALGGPGELFHLHCPFWVDRKLPGGWRSRGSPWKQRHRSQGLHQQHFTIRILDIENGTWGYPLTADADQDFINHSYSLLILDDIAIASGNQDEIESFDGDVEKSVMVWLNICVLLRGDN